MYCPFCNSEDTRVVNSRLTRSNTQVWRRRRCQDCKEIFTTHEIIDLSHLIVVKRSGRMQQFSRMKLYASIYGATIGSKTPDRERLVDTMTRDIERQILACRKKQITSTEISDITLRTLKRTNPRTFLRWLAYNKNIQSEADMIREFNRYTRKI